MDLRNGKYFIAYKGNTINQNTIKSFLTELNNDGNYIVKEMLHDDVYFSKIVYNEYIDDRDPYKYNNIMSVNGYKQSELRNACSHNGNYSYGDDDQCHRLINCIYSDYKNEVFKKLSSYMDFCSIIYDVSRKNFVAGCTTSKEVYSHLYYGFTEKEGEIMFSNNYNAIRRFCDEVNEMEPNTYYENNEIYDLNGVKIKDVISEKDTGLIKSTSQNAQNIIDGINALLIQVTNDSVKEKIVQNIDEYLKSDDPKKKIEDFINENLDLETNKKVRGIIDEVTGDYVLESRVKELLHEKFNEILQEYAEDKPIPIVNVIKLNDIEVGRTGGEFFHDKFEQILTQIQLDEPVMLIGPAGSGKNHCIAQIAKGLGKNMYYTNNASNEFKLTGFIDAGGNYRDTEFYKAFKNGGIFFLDEIDNSDPSALIVINSALANGYMAFPHETIDKHPDFRCVAAANTWGKGSDLQYVGRNALDGATLDRFDNIFFDYDRNLERALSPDDEVLNFMWSFRDAVDETKIPHIVSTRGIGKVYKKHINNLPVEDILTSNVVKNLGQDDLNTLIGSMNGINESNKYYAGVKRLRLGR